MNIRAKIGGANVHQAIMAITDNGTNTKALFSKATLRELGTTSTDELQDYSKIYKQAGIIQEVGSYGKEKRTIYRIAKCFPSTPPKLTSKGTLATQSHQKIWVAIRKLRDFNKVELQASVEKNSHATISAFLQKLKHAGIVELQGNRRWKLVDDIGPLAPRLINKQKTLYDPNNDRIIK